MLLQEYVYEIIIVCYVLPVIQFCQLIFNDTTNCWEGKSTQHQSKVPVIDVLHSYLKNPSKSHLGIAFSGLVVDEMIDQDSDHTWQMLEKKHAASPGINVNEFKQKASK